MKRILGLILIFTMMLSVANHSAEAQTPDSSEDSIAEQIVQRIEDTYEAALRSAGRSRFYNRCVQMVNHSLCVLGLENHVMRGDGRDEYNNFNDMARTGTGYDVLQFSAADYDLTGALYAAAELQEGPVYNLIACWDGGSSYNSRRYGHTAFIHAVYDGKVYFSESYSLKINGTLYKEGQPIVCTIEEFAGYYDQWAKFEGLVCLEAADIIPPELSGVVVREKTEKGFTLNFRAKDNEQIKEIYAKVWPYGGNEETAAILPAQLENGFATVRVDTSRFDGFVGRYYILCYAADKKGNQSVAELVHEDCVNLYTSQEAEGLYEVKTPIAGLHNAPYAVVRGEGTLSGILSQGERFEIIGQWINEDGQIWYQLDDENWVNSAYVVRRIRWEDVKKYLEVTLQNLWEYSSNK